MQAMNLRAIFSIAAILALEARAEEVVPDFAEVYRILDERCVECHAKDDNENDLVLEALVLHVCSLFGNRDCY